jgi:hypothetical protein
VLASLQTTHAFALYFCVFLALTTLLSRPSPPCTLSLPPLRRKGWRIMASEGALPAPPLQGGMGDASPQGASPAPPLQGGMGDASLAPQGALPAPPLQGGWGMPPWHPRALCQPLLCKGGWGMLDILVSSILPLSTGSNIRLQVTRHSSHTGPPNCIGTLVANGNNVAHNLVTT